MRAFIFCAIAILTAALVGCGGGGGTSDASPVPPGPNSAAFVTISSPDASSRTTNCESIDFRGLAFISPTLFHCCSGNGSDTAVTVTWTNNTTGQSGPAIQFVDELFNQILDHKWLAH